MKEHIVPFETAKKLKDEGYPQSSFGNFSMSGPTYVEDGRLYEDGCICYKDDACTAPTISEAMMWLRKEKELHVVCPFYKDVGFYYYVQRIGSAARIVSSFDDSDDCYDSYEQAALAGIEYILNKLI